jgi:cob(I)alamin adenosyltransferase
MLSVYTIWQRRASGAIMLAVRKIYSKRGDGGETEILGKKIRKDNNLVEALGSIDELNSWIGYVRTRQTFRGQIPNELKNIQSNLLVISSGLAGRGKGLKPGETERLEELIDKLSAKLPPLTSFIYPAGEIHIARTVARRAERSIVRISNNKGILEYMNRLSDALFVIARWVNIKKGLKEEVWKG